MKPASQMSFDDLRPGDLLIFNAKNIGTLLFYFVIGIDRYKDKNGEPFNKITFFASELDGSHTIVTKAVHKQHMLIMNEGFIFFQLEQQSG